MTRRTVTAAATALIPALFLFLANCGSSSGGGSASCTVGETLPCTGAAGCAGVQTCSVENIYAACVCQAADSGVSGVQDSGLSGVDSTTLDSGSNQDSTVSANDTGSSQVDTGTTSSDTGTAIGDTGTASDSPVTTGDTGTPNDASRDTGFDSGGMCPDDTAFTAITWAPPTPLHQGVCTAAQINAWVASQDQNTGLGMSGNTACDECIVTPESATLHGPIVTLTQSGTTFAAEANVGGCVAVEDGMSAAGSCGNKLNNFDDCLNLQCADCADFDSTMQSPTGPTATCEQAVFAAGGACAAEDIANNSACATELETDGGVDQSCLSAATLQDLFTIWCGGTPVTDGGHDAQPDGSHESGADGSLTCPPASTAGYATVTYVASTAHQGVCSTAQISAFITACGDNGTTSSCDTWQDTNVAGDVDGSTGTTCGNCIFAPQNNGALWIDQGFFQPNYAGCIQLTDTTNGTSCATAYNNLGGCTSLACDKACPTGDTNPADQQACIDTAAGTTGSCHSYLVAEASACPTDFADGGAVTTCSPGSATNTLNPDLQYITTLICGH